MTAIYIHSLKGNGGVTTFVKNLVTSLSDKISDLTLIVGQAGTEVETRLAFELAHYCNVEFVHKNYENYFQTVILASSWGVQLDPDKIKANKYIEVIHADASKTTFRYVKRSYVDQYVCVSKNNQRMFLKRFPEANTSVVRNFIPESFPRYPKQKNKELTLIVCSRISRAKGFKRLLKLNDLLQEEVTFHIYGEIKDRYARSFQKLAPYNFIFHGYIEDPAPEIAKADYLVQLSDSEGMSYSVLEALHQRTPVISTDYPSAKEVLNSDNSIMLDMELKNLCNFMIENQLKRIKIRKNETENHVEKWLKLLK